MPAKRNGLGQAGARVSGGVEHSGNRSNSSLLDLVGLRLWQVQRLPAHDIDAGRSRKGGRRQRLTPRHGWSR